MSMALVSSSISVLTSVWVWPPGNIHGPHLSGLSEWFSTEGSNQWDCSIFIQLKPYVKFDHKSHVTFHHSPIFINILVTVSESAFSSCLTSVTSHVIQTLLVLKLRWTHSSWPWCSWVWDCQISSNTVTSVKLHKEVRLTCELNGTFIADECKSRWLWTLCGHGVALGSCRSNPCWASCWCQGLYCFSHQAEANVTACLRFVCLHLSPLCSPTF